MRFYHTHLDQSIQCPRCSASDFQKKILEDTSAKYGFIKCVDCGYVIGKLKDPTKEFRLFMKNKWMDDLKAKIRKEKGLDSS